MKNDTGAITAANSKTMNAVVQPKFFAAASDTDAIINLPEEVPVKMPYKAGKRRQHAASKKN